MKKYLRHTLCILLMLAVLTGLFTGCTSSDNVEQQTYGSEGYCEIYYVDNITQMLKAENVIMDSEKQNEQVLSLFKKLSGIAKTEERSGVVPRGLEINSISIDNGTLTIDFNAVYNSMTAGEELAFRAAAVYTFTSLDFVDYLLITVDGNELKTAKGMLMGKLGREDVIMNGDISAEPTNYEILTLYFENSEGSALSTEIREVQVNPNLPVERYIVEQVIAGPEDESLRSTVPYDTKIRDISTADGVCYVDLSVEFVNKQLGLEKDALAAVYSIVNSLCEIEDVTKVQFLIEGEKLDSYRNVIDLSKPVEPNYDIQF
ncbi:MAG: hypothetical protein EGQ35_05630 [Clostridiales bacterium]|nr:hypothetical protein [Clostridiales bacterium]